jgi:hypothetical protein
MSVALTARVLAVCLEAGQVVPARGADPLPGPSTVREVATGAATPTPTTTPTSTPIATASPEAVERRPGAGARANRGPPPVVLLVPMLGPVMLPLVFPTAQPRKRAPGTSGRATAAADRAAPDAPTAASPEAAHPRTAP